MVKKKAKGNPGVNRAAEAVGHLLGNVAGTIDSLREQHPDPSQEARDALASGDEALAAALSTAKKRTAPMIKKAKALARQAKQTLAAARQSTRPSGSNKAQTKTGKRSDAPKQNVTSAKMVAKKVVKRAKQAVRGAKKAIGRKR